MTVEKTALGMTVEKTALGMTAEKTAYGKVYVSEIIKSNSFL